MPTITVSHRGQITPTSPIRKLAPAAKKAVTRGARVLHLNIGQPDIEAPQEYRTALASYDSRLVGYEPAKGSEALCAEWSNYMNRCCGVVTKPEQFLITCGASEALMYAMMVAADAGDEIIVFEPTYANYLGFAALSDVKLVPVTLKLEENFALPPAAEIEKVITAKTKAILICNPNNPTGTICTREEQIRLLTICEKHNLFLIADETYREYTYDGSNPLSIYNIFQEHPRVIVVDSLSKRFSLCGARIGCFISANPDVFGAALRMAQARLAAPSAEQYAALQLLKNISDNFVREMIAEYKKRRDVLFGALKKILGVVAHEPQGAFYTIVGLPVKNAEQFATFMLEEVTHKGCTTFVAPATGFYITPNSGLNEVRMAYVLKAPDLELAVEVLGEGLKRYGEG